MKNDSYHEKKISFEDLSKDVQDRIVKNNSMDIDIYNYVRYGPLDLWQNNFGVHSYWGCVGVRFLVDQCLELYEG